MMILQPSEQQAKTVATDGRQALRDHHDLTGQHPALELHFSAQDIAEMWKLSPDSVRRLFEGEPGVLVIQHPTLRRRRRYRTLRVPQSVVERVHRRLSNKGKTYPAR